MPNRHKPVFGGDLCAIFVHAGAGFHSFQNQRHHLAACHDAAKVGMTVLKNGGDAIDAVEMCIRVLEDREITNAGFGSNLNAEGHVECDATMVDHLGRSGAIGAASCKYRHRFSPNAEH
jgi:taspase, threonine aspartase, 1